MGFYGFGLGTTILYDIATRKELFSAVLCAIMGIVLFGFFGWHLNLVRTATTTNELSKWNYIKWCLKHEGAEGKEKIKQLRNIYNQGCISNFREVFFPIDV